MQMRWTRGHFSNTHVKKKRKEREEIPPWLYPSGKEKRGELKTQTDVTFLKESNYTDVPNRLKGKKKDLAYPVKDLKERAQHWLLGSSSSHKLNFSLVLPSRCNQKFMERTGQIYDFDSSLTRFFEFPWGRILFLVSSNFPSVLFYRVNLYY